MRAAVDTVVTLGPTYLADLWDLRKRIKDSRDKNRALITVGLRVPVVSDPVDIALLSGSLYLIGIRNSRFGWMEFAPDEQNADPSASGHGTPRLPGSRWIMAGRAPSLSTYRALRLRWMFDEQHAAGKPLLFRGRPGELLKFLAIWDGQISSDFIRLRLCVLILLVCDALRFRSIEDMCDQWIFRRGFRTLLASLEPGQDMPDVYRSPPNLEAVDWPVLEFTGAMIDTMQNWRTSARAGDPDVQTWLPGMTDRLFE